MKIEDLKPGMIVYKSGKSGRYATNWTINIIVVDIPNKIVLASLNNNPSTYYNEKNYSKWRKDPRIIVNTLMGTRFATRTEIAEMKSKKIIINY